MIERVRPAKSVQAKDKQPTKHELRMQRAAAAGMAKAIQEEANKRSAKVSKSQVKEVRRAMQLSIFQARKHGRPVLYNEAMDALMYDYRMLGIQVDRIAHFLGISTPVLYQWLEQYPDFLEAFNKGGDLADATVARALYHRAIGYSHKAEKIQFDKDGNELRAEYIEHYPPDAGAAQFWLTNRQKDLWKSRQSTELSGPDGQPLQPPAITIQGVIAKPRLE